MSLGNKFVNQGQTVVAALAIVVTCLLPLKFGSIVGVPEVAGYYPQQLFAWLIISWPVYCFPIVVGGLLCGALICFPLPQRSALKPSLINLTLWLLLPLVATIGFINASVLDFPIIETVHLTGIACWGIVIWLILANRPAYQRYFYIAIFVSIVITLLLSLEQYFSGFEETREFVAMQVKRTGVAVNSDLDNILTHPRVFGPFGLCNSLAAHLLLTIPLCFALLWQWCGKIEPPKISRMIFIIPFTASALAIFYLTGSRAALLAEIAALACFMQLLPVNNKIKLFTMITGLLGCIGGVIAMKYMGRTFASITVRIDYLLRSIDIFMKHPWVGTGWGDFFHDYMSLKAFFHKEAPHTPHNIIMAFTSQTGICGLVAIISALLYPIYCGAKQLLTGKLPLSNVIVKPKSMILLGIIAWTIHSLADINLQIPGTMATAIMLIIMLTLPKNAPTSDMVEDKSTPLYRKFGWRLIAAMFAITALYGGLKLTQADYTMSQLGALCDYRNKTRAEFLNIQPNIVMIGLARCNKLVPYSPYPYRIAGQFMAARGYIKESQKLYHEALKRSPERPSIYFQLYLLSRAAGNRDDAIKYLLKAVTMFPKNEKYLKAALAEGLINTTTGKNAKQ